MGAVKNNWAILSSSFASKHQHLQTILILILFKLLLVEILLLQTFQIEKFTLKGNPFTQIGLYSSFFLFLCLIIFHVDLTVNLP